MKIDANTRISELIKENKDSIDAIASLAKPLEKLKNPILRKIMASRVTIGEAAKMGGCKIEDFARVLQPLGFEFESTKKEDQNVVENRPRWLEKLTKEHIENFDVREILSTGDDPLKHIIARFKQVEVGKALCIINSFIPTPLIHLLEKEGVQTYTEDINNAKFHTYFYKSHEKKRKSPPLSNGERVFMDDQASFEALCAEYNKGQLKEIDVRHLEMPMPMQTILQELSSLADQEALYVHHKRIPIYLLEELADQDFQVHVRNLDDSDVKLLIFRS